MQSLTMQKYFYYIAFMLMASTYLPLLFNNLPYPMNSHHIWTIIWGLSLYVFQPKIFFNKAMQYLMTYGLLFFLATKTIWSNIDVWNYNALINEFYQISVGVSMITYFSQNKDYIHLAKITKWSIVFFFITAIMTIISSAIDPMYARNLLDIGAVVSKNKESILSFKRYGGGTYSYAGAFMCLFPIFSYYYKNIKISIVPKKQIILVSSLIFLALLRMQIFAYIMIAFLFSVIAFLSMEKVKYSIVMIVLFFSIMSVIPKEFYVNSLQSVSGYFAENSELNYKFRDLAIFIETGADIEDRSTGAGGRANRYKQLSESFIQSPILGCLFNSGNYAHGYFKNYYNYGSIGQVEGTHLYWMNKLTITGIVGLFMFLVIPFSHIKNNLKYFNSTYKFYYILASLSILCYGLFKTVGGRETWYAFFIILPGLYYLPLLKEKSGVTSLMED